MVTATYSVSGPAPGFVSHPEHEVDIKLFRGTVTVTADGVQIASSKFAVLVRETNHSPVYYLPLEDVNAKVLRDSSHISRCPFKGKARYWNVKIGNHEIDNALWGYEMPYDEVLELAGLVAFYESKVEITATPST
ncbi:MAG: hypothetical protein COC17_02745 [Hyphomicrobiales bacterium]|nr:MAG: hypothetical protein COC17_02745 [Hyphomicrobiales bacterium]